jgi:hypothetical protein
MLGTNRPSIRLESLGRPLREAQQSARELLADAIRWGKDTVPEAFVIADERGRKIATLPLEALLPEPLKRK